MTITAVGAGAAPGDGETAVGAEQTGGGAPPSEQGQRRVPRSWAGRAAAARLERGRHQTHLDFCFKIYKLFNY